MLGPSPPSTGSAQAGGMCVRWKQPWTLSSSFQFALRALLFANDEPKF